MAGNLAGRLVELSKKLKLNDRQTRFVMELAKDPERNQTRAAIAAGVTSKVPHVWASKTIKLGKVREFLGKVEEGVRQRAEERALEEQRLAAVPIEEGIMEAAEHQLRLSRLARADIGRHIEVDADGQVRVKVDAAHTGIIREITTDEIFGGDEGKGAIVRTRLKVADPLPALVALGRVRGWEKTEPNLNEANSLAVQILGAATLEAFKAAYLKLVSGNGHGAPNR